MKEDKVLTLIKHITYELDRKKPSHEGMIQDIKMMNFKIRPISGDISLLASYENGFLEAVWKIGKMESLVKEGIKTLNHKERVVFFRYLDGIRQNIQSRIHMSQPHHSELSGERVNTLELEIFKEYKTRNTSLN